MLLIINSHNLVLNFIALIEDLCDNALPSPLFLLPLSSLAFQFLLDFKVGVVALFHILIHSLQPLLVLLDTASHLGLKFGKLFKHLWIVNLPWCSLEQLRSFLLYIQKLILFVPLTLEVFGFNKCIRCIIYFQSCHYLLYFFSSDAIPSLLEDFQSLQQIFVPFCHFF
jgi:hypothetical protein